MTSTIPVYVDDGELDDPARPWWVRRGVDVFTAEWWHRFAPVPVKRARRK